MTKFRASILICGMIVICIVVALATILVLAAAGVIITDRIEIEVCVNDASKVYDGTPLKADGFTFTDGELMEGHTARAEYTGEQTDAGTGLSGLNLKVFDGNGEEVTEHYHVKVIPGKLSVVINPISVRLNDCEVVYSGEKLVLDDYEITEGRIGQGHQIFAAVRNAGIINVGDNVSEDMIPIVCDAQGNDVTSNYNVNFTVGDVRITARPIALRPADLTKEYDGTPLKCSTYEIVSGSFVNGQYAEVSVSLEEGGAASLTDVGSMTTVITDVTVYAVSEGEKRDVTHNYEISLAETGTLTVTKAKVSVALKAYYKEYDGEAFDLDEKSDEILEQFSSVSSEFISVVWAEEKENAGLNAGTYFYTVQFSEEVRKNYDFIVTDGTVNVSKATVSGMLPDFDCAFTNEVFTFTREQLDRIYENCSPLDGRDLKIVYEGTVKNAGDYSYNVAFVNSSMNANVNLYVEAGNIRISPVALKMTNTLSVSKVYDGAAAVVKPSEIQLDFAGAAVSSVEYEEVVNVTANRQIKLTSPRILDSSTREDITGNFLFDANAFGTVSVTVTPRKLSLTADAVTIDFDPETYDGKTGFSSFITNEKAIGAVKVSTMTPLVSNDRVENLSVQVNSATSDSYTLRLTGLTVYNAQNENVSANYQVGDTLTGQLVVNKYSETIALPSFNYTYEEWQAVDNWYNVFYDALGQLNYNSKLFSVITPELPEITGAGSYSYSIVIDEEIAPYCIVSCSGGQITVTE